MLDLKSIRQEIDALDKELVALLEKRMDLVENVIRCKIENNIEIFDAAREDEVLAKNLKRVKQEKYKETIKVTLAAIMDYSKDYQKKFLEENSK